MKRCRVAHIFEQAEEEAKKQLKADRLWRGEEWFRGLISDFARVTKRLEMTDGRVTGAWPLRLALLGEAVLDARMEVDAHEAGRG